MRWFVITAMLWSLASGAVAQTSAPAAAQSQQTLSAEQLDQLVAPIALYPDTLLAEVLMASTYPLEVVEADRWATQNQSLKGDQLKSAVDKQSWDDSVKALVATPSALNMMSTKLDWTQKLGDAVLAQQPDIMDAVQRLRSKAQAQNTLSTTKEQKVSVTQQDGRQAIVIEPAQPDTIYVPYYDPAVVYGPWPYPAYPPYYFAPPRGYVAGAALATGIAFGVGYAVGRWASGGNYWGGGCNWNGNTINVNRPININNTAINNWIHNPDHRHGVRYSNPDVAQRFGKGGLASGAQARLDYRGRSGEQVLRPGADRPGIGEPGLGQRPNIGDRRPGQPPNLGNLGRGNLPSINRPAHDNAFANMGSGKLANLASQRGRASLGGGGPRFGGGGRNLAGAGGGIRGGGAGLHGGGGGIRGGGRRR